MTRTASFVLLSFLACACSKPASAPAPAEDASKEAPAAGQARTLKVTPELQKKWGVATGAVERLALSGTLKLPGVLALNQRQSAQISALLDGKVVTIGADLGSHVKKNQVLLVLHSPAFAQAQTALLQAASRRNVARRELDRSTALLKEEAIQPREHQRRQAEFEAATTDYGLAESNPPPPPPPPPPSTPSGGTTRRSTPCCSGRPRGAQTCPTWSIRT